MLGRDIKKEIVPKDEHVDFGLPSETVFPRQTVVPFCICNFWLYDYCQLLIRLFTFHFFPLLSRIIRQAHQEAI